MNKKSKCCSQFGLAAGKMFLCCMAMTAMGFTTHATPAPDSNEVTVAGVAKQGIKGVVTDENGEPVVGASVTVKGQPVGVSTGLDGQFSLNVAAGSEVTISCIGQDPVTFKVKAGKTDYDVTMRQADNSLDEVVVVGYGQQKKVNLTGSVTTVNFDKINKGRSIMNSYQALAGIAPGVSTAETSGQPGQEGVTIRIRGNNTFNTNAPLVMIDGVEGSMQQLNPNDIATISVLKDASSCAIYGARAAGGVILVTTKRGEGKPRFTYSFTGTWQRASNRMKTLDDYARYMELSNEASDNSGGKRVFSDETIQEWKDAAANPYGLNDAGMPNYLTHPNTDWFKEIFNTGFTQEHNVAVSGSTPKVSYLMSARILDNNGVMNRFNLDSGQEKINITANIDAKPLSWLNVGTRIRGLRQKLGVTNIANAYTYLFRTTPGVTVGEPGKWGFATATEESANANNLFQQMYGTDGWDKYWSGNTNFYAIITPYKGLSFEANYTYYIQFHQSQKYGRRNTIWDYRTDTMYKDSSLATTTVTNGSTTNSRYNIDLLARYNTTIAGKHDIGILLGYNETMTKYRGFTAQRKGASDWGIHELSTFSEVTGAASSTPYEYGLRSYFGRVNYAFDNRYLFEANLRADGSSRFGPDSRWGYFPSFSAGWRISQEEFMAATRNVISNLKLRGSWGKSGNNAVGNYDWQSTYAINSVVLDGVGTKGLYQSVIGNTLLHWENTATTDIGIDFGLFNQHLTGEIDYYNKKTSDILFTPPMFLTMGNVSTAKQNQGKIDTKGFDFNITWNDNVGDFQYSVGLNMSFNRSKVTSFKGQYEAGWVEDENGNRTYVTNFSDVTASFDNGRICEGHILGEYYNRRTYSGTGAGYNGGEVDINAGPRDGMIRTEADMAWVRAMIDAGYKFSGLNKIDRNQLWYGDRIYADANGDGNYGDSQDMIWTGRSSTPKYYLGLNLAANYKNFDLSMIWTGAFGHYFVFNNTEHNGAVINWGSSISKRVADDHYFYDPDNVDDPRTNLTAWYPRLVYSGLVSSANNQASEKYEYKGDYLRLKNMQIGYTIPRNITRKFYVENFRAYVSMDNILTFTKYPGVDPEMGLNVNYPLMKQVSVGAQITF